MASVKKKPREKKRQSAVDRLSHLVMKMIKVLKASSARRRIRGIRFISFRSKIQKRDRYGRFAKTNRLGLAKQQPTRLRDEKGRFISSSAQGSVYRDKRGRFAKAPLPWHRRRPVMWAPVVLGLMGVFYFGWQINKPIVIEEPVAVQSQESEPIKAQVAFALNESIPTRLRIPKIGVDTSFVTIGKNANDTMEVPKQHDVVGWYKLGPTPGELGPAILVGHVDRPGGPAVFWRLREMVPGDTFEIDREDGSVAKFRVDSVKQFPQDSFPTEEVYGNIDHAGIRVITCGGTYVRSVGRYTHNTVVYGSLLVEKKVSAAN